MCSRRRRLSALFHLPPSKQMSFPRSIWGNTSLSLLFLLVVLRFKKAPKSGLSQVMSTAPESRKVATGLMEPVCALVTLLQA